MQQQMVALLWRLVQNIAQIAKPRPQRHHMAFTQRVDGWVCHLREILPEKVMQPPIMPGQHRQRRIITHRADRLFSGLRHRLQHKFCIFHSPASHKLPASCLLRIQRLAGFACCICQQRIHLFGAANPLLPVAFRNKRVFQLLIPVKLSLGQIDADHLARPKPSTLGDIGVRHHHHASFRTSNHQPVMGHNVTQWTKPVAIKPGHNPVTGIGGNRRWPVPWLHHRIAIGI